MHPGKRNVRSRGADARVSGHARVRQSYSRISGKCSASSMSQFGGLENREVRQKPEQREFKEKARK